VWPQQSDRKLSPSNPFYLKVAMALASDKIGQDAIITIIPKTASSAK
jgi:hypothetical protein